MKKSITTAVLLLLAIVLLSTQATAQTSNATLGGTVADATGALIPGVEVTAKNVATGIVNTTITNESGAYQFASLQTGSYQVSAALAGFQTATNNSVTLGGSEQVRLNFVLRVGDLTTTVDVTADVEGGALITTSSSIGTVLPEMQVRELPTGDRNVLELLRGVGGAGPTEGDIDGYFAGGRISQVVVSRDGFNVSAGRYNQGTFSTTYTSSDLVEEVKVTTGTVDAEASRGSGQVQMVTRSGTNQYRGSIFWNNRNSRFDSSNWFSNFNGATRDWQNRNQFGGRLGGPIIKNKTFFFVLVDEQRFVAKESFVGTVLTAPARQGLFRYFPTVDNANVLQTGPTVDRQGNPLDPRPAANQTLPLQTINLFAYDPNRPGFDPTGYMSSVIARMPLPNDYTVGDGLNTAGIRFTRRIYGRDQSDGFTYDENNRDQVNLRIDHNFNSAHKASFVYTYERGMNHTTQAGVMQWPGGFDGANRKFPRLYNFSLVSTVSNVVNELRIGYRAHKIQSWAPWYVGREGYTGEVTEESAKEAFSLLPKFNGLSAQVVPLFYGQGYMQFSSGFGSTRGSWSPLLSYGDTVSWIKGKHSFKAGGEFRRDRTDGWNDNNFTPYITIGAGNFTSPITPTTAGITGLTNNNSTNARNLLYNLAGSVDNIRQGFDLVSSSGPLAFKGYQDGITLKKRDWRANEFSGFFKDDWKVTSNLSLNLGVHYEWFGVPYEGRGLAGRVVNGFQGLCGIGCGALTTVELVGKNSPNPDAKLFNDDWNNLAPSFGFSYSIPGLGKQTILRGGYGISYTGAMIKGAMGAGGLDAGGGTLPGLAGISGGNGLTYTQATYWNLANVVLPFAPQFQPLAAVPLTDPRTLTMNMYEPNRVSPYVQNFNLSIQRQITGTLTLDVSYVGSKGSKLFGRNDLNYTKIQGAFLDAFNTTRAGGNAPLFDQMLMGMNIPGAGVVNGTTVTGSQALRLYTNTRTFLANGSVGGLANFLNTSTTITNRGGGYIRNSGQFPEDYIVFNPQFSSVGVNGNLSNSTYHSMQIQVTKRLSHGITNRTGYTWSRTIGLSDDDNNVAARDPLNRNLDKSVLGYHRTHNLTSNGTLELPFGPNRAFLNSAPAWVSRIVERWQLGGVMAWSSGGPLTLSAGSLTNIYQQATNTPMILGEMPEGKVTRMSDGSLPNYFPTLTLGAAGSDPGRSAVTGTNSLATFYTNRAILDASGNPLLINPGPGQVGTVGIRTIEGPGRFTFDMNLLKKVAVSENKEFEVRVDMVNVLNHPVFGNPNVDINSASFGRISTAGDGRRFTIGARLNF
jgi:hypothetical protein